MLRTLNSKVVLGCPTSTNAKVKEAKDGLANQTSKGAAPVIKTNHIVLYIQTRTINNYTSSSIWLE